MHKAIKIFLINLLIFGLLFLLLEIVFCAISYKNYVDSSTIKLDSVFPQNYLQTVSFDELYEKIRATDADMRKPVGLEYKKKPIVIFGCSFAFGDTLKNEQTFSYKLSKITKRPVYNFSACSWGFQQMLYQLRKPEFYKQFESNPEYVIYIYMSQHIQRMFLPTYMFPFNNNLFLRYEIVNDDLREIKPKVPFIQRSNILYNLNLRNAYKKSREEKYLKENSKLIKMYFDSSRKEAEKHWGKVKFVIIKYSNNESKNDIYFDASVWDELEKQGFIVIDTKEVAGRTFDKEKDFSYDKFHPSESVWDEFVPLFVKKIPM